MTARRIVAGMLVALLAASMFLNVVLLQRFVRCYRALHMLCLDPTGASAFSVGTTPDEDGGGEPLVILLGDSRIAQWSPLPAVADCRVIDRGISGQTTALTLLRLERDVLTPRPRVVVVQIGINDLKLIGLFPERKRFIVESCWRNIQELVDRMTAANIDVVLLTVFPPGPVGLLRTPVWSDDIVRCTDEINNRMLRLNESRLTVVDCDSILMLADGLRRKYARDTLHLTPSAYKALNRHLEPILQQLVCDYKTE